MQFQNYNDTICPTTMLVHFACSFCSGLSLSSYCLFLMYNTDATLRLSLKRNPSKFVYPQKVVPPYRFISSCSQSNNSNDNYDRISKAQLKIFTIPLHRKLSPTHAQAARAQSCANHEQHFGRLSRAACHVPLGMKGQLS